MGPFLSILKPYYGLNENQQVIHWDIFDSLFWSHLNTYDIIVFLQKLEGFAHFFQKRLETILIHQFIMHSETDMNIKAIKGIEKIPKKE